MLLPVAGTKCDEDTAVRCLSVTFFEVSPPWNTSTSRCLQHCTLQTQSPMTHLYPLLRILDPVLILLWASTSYFKTHYFFAMHIIHLPFPPCITDPCPGTSSCALASPAMRHHFLLLFPKTPSHFPKNLFPQKTQVLVSTRLHIYQQHCSSLVHRLQFSFPPVKTVP